MSRRRRASFNWLWVILLVVVVLPLAAVGAIYAFVDPNAFKPRIAEAVRSATGRELTLAGPITIGFSLSPSLKASDVSLSNPPGFSRPQMATLGQVEAQLALWPLLSGRIEIIRLVLAQPDLMLETNAAGAHNWQFAPSQNAPIAQPQAPVQVKEVAAPTAPRFAVASVRITDGKITWLDAKAGAGRVVGIKQFSATSADTTGSMSATADITSDGHDVSLTAETGPIAQLLGGVVPPPGWPLQVVARVEGARVAVAGLMQRPTEGAGYQLSFDASAPELGPLGTAIGQTLPALHDVSGSAKLSDVTGKPVLSDLMLRAGASDLKSIWNGLSLERLQASASGTDQPLHAEADGAVAGTKFHVVATTGTPSMLMPGAPAANLPVDISVQAAGSSLSAKGTVAVPATFSGVDLALAARIADLSALSSLAGRPLPSMRDVKLDARLTDQAGGIGDGVVLHGLVLSAPQGDIGGDVMVGFKPRLSVQGQLNGKRLDVDAIEALFPAPQAVASTPAPSPSPVPAPKAGGARQLISDKPFDLSGFDVLDVDLTSTLGELRSGGVSYRDLTGHLVLDQGKLALDPFSATLPGGKLDLRLTANTRDAEPPVTLTLNAPGLALKPLLTAFHLPDDVTGTIELAADVTAAGRSPHALAASLSGKVGALMTDGELDTALIGPLLGGVLKAAHLPADLANGAGRIRQRCFATRMDFTHGVGTVGSFVLDNAKVLIQGGGAINLGSETLALRLRPLLRTGGPGVVIPVRVTGSFANPNFAVDAGGALEGNAGLLAQIPGLSRSPFGALVGAVSGERGGDACGPALAAARGARPNAK